MKLPRDLSGADVSRRLAPSLRLPRDSEAEAANMTVTLTAEGEQQAARDTLLRLM